MTSEEFEQAKKEITLKIDQLNIDYKNLCGDYIASFPFKYGDKVVVINNSFKHPYSEKIVPEKRTECFIGEIKMKYGSINYDLRKVKKDGTISGQSASIYSFDRIEKI